MITPMPLHLRPRDARRDRARAQRLFVDSAHRVVSAVAAAHEIGGPFTFTWSPFRLQRAPSTRAPDVVGDGARVRAAVLL
jgi:hypothetical protein